MSMGRSARRRILALAAAGSLVTAACGGDGDDSGSPPTELSEITADDPSLQTTAYSESVAVEVDVEQVPSSPIEDTVSGLETWREPPDALPPPTIDLAVLRSGGPPPDGIPSIDDPHFHRADTVDYLAPADPVVALEIDGDARAYPLEILIWHELVNDTVGGVPVSVAYCPLCNSVTVYERDVEGRVLDFGVSGLLYNSSLVMYDRQTETLWSHFTGEPLHGELVDADLVALPATIAGFGAWSAEHPDGLVLNRETGVDRDYGVNPYPGYDDVDSDPFLFEGEVDGRFTAMTRVVGVESPVDGAVAFPLLQLRDERVQLAQLGDEAAVAFWSPGSTSALDGSQVSGGVDVGTTGVFDPVVDGRELTFVASRDTDGEPVIVDEETGSTWNVFGEATAGELAGTRLDQYPHIDTFWFAWIAFHPDSVVV